MSRDCPLESKLPCFLCGVCGHHRNRCPEEICYNCNRPGHQSRDCKLPRKRRMHSGDYCARCRHPGHLAKDCSLNWRQYRFAIKQLPRDDDALWRDFRKIDRCCYNCAALDHFGDECPQRRKKPEWSIFHEPDLRFLRMTFLSSTKGNAEVVTEGVAAAPKKNSSPKSNSFNGRARDEREAKRSDEQAKKEQAKPKPKESPRKPPGSSSNSSRTAEPAKKQHRHRIEEDGSNYYQVNDGSYHGPRRRSRSPPRRPPSGKESSKAGGTYKGGYKK
jgi:cellular nucleic acid-binding protein